MPIHLAFLALLVGSGQAKRPGPPPRVFPVAKILGKSPDAAKPIFDAVRSKLKERRSWVPPRGHQESPHPEPDSLTDISGNHGSGTFFLDFGEGAPMPIIFGKFEDGKVACVELRTPKPLTWQQHLQMAGLSSVGVRAKRLVPRLFVLEGINGLPVGTRVTRTLDQAGDGSEIEFRLAPKRSERIPISSLCDYSKVMVGWGEVGRDVTVDRNPLTIGGRTFTHGMGTHSVSKIAFELKGKSSSFRSWVGVDDETKGKGSVIFKILGDGKILWESGVMRGGEPAKRVDVELKGVKRLELVVQDAGDGIDDDHADWGHAVLDWTDPATRPQFLPTGGRQGTYTLPPVQDRTYASYPIQRFKCVFVVADDDGSYRHTSDDGRKNRLETAQDCARIVAEINAAYAPAGIQLDYDATSYVRRNSTALNRRFFSPLSGGPIPSEKELREPSKMPPMPMVEEYSRARDALREEFPDRIVFVFMSDALWTWRGDKGRWDITTTSGGWSGPEGVNCICGTNAPVCIHELGHYFGLDHTHDKRPNRSTFETEVSRALTNGQTFEEAMARYDADGLPDTPADPGQLIFEGYEPFRSQPYEFVFTGPGGTVTTVYLRPDAAYNWMSYYREHRSPHPRTGRVEGRFSRLQCMVMYTRASQRPWRPVFEAVHKGDVQKVGELTRAILSRRTDETARFYGRIARSWPAPKSALTPAKVATSASQIFLSDFAEAEVSVGWGRPTYNRGPLDRDHSTFLTVGGRIFGKGIHAHAPSRIAYDLGGVWTRFTVKAGVMDHSRFGGTVQFQIVGDGKVLANSSTLRCLQLHEFSLDVTGVRTLSLEASDGGDGAKNDWAAWLDPKLTR